MRVIGWLSRAQCECSMEYFIISKMSNASEYLWCTRMKTPWSGIVHATLLH
jgi:hypothetical protein